MIEEINKTTSGFLPAHMVVYLETGHKNGTINRSQEKDVESKLNKLTAYIYTEIQLKPFVGSIYRHIRRLKVGKSH